MKKIPTMFDRDWTGNPGRVVDKIAAGCEWVAAGEGSPTRKLDGTCCLVREGKLYKRREMKAGDVAPQGFEPADIDEETGKCVGWVPVGDGPDDKWHREAFAAPPLFDGTYELLGPKIQGNPERWDAHVLVAHRDPALELLPTVPRTFDGLRDYLAHVDIEGIVFHHPDGRMAKIKLKDFGLKRAKAAA